MQVQQDGSRGNAPPHDAMTASMARRIENQVERVFRRTYGARTGFRTLAILGAQQMVGAGAQRPAIREALTQCVLRQLTADTDYVGAWEEREAAARELTALIEEWVSEERRATASPVRPRSRKP